MSPQNQMTDIMFFSLLYMSYNWIDMYIWGSQESFRATGIFQDGYWQFFNN